MNRDAATNGHAGVNHDAAVNGDAALTRRIRLGRRRGGRLALARPTLVELLLVAVSLSLLPSAGRILEGWSFVAPLGSAALIAHVVVALVRRARLGVTLGALASLVAVAAQQLWVHYPHTTLYGLPQRATAQALGADFAAARDALTDTTVPLAPGAGLVIIAAAIVWAVAVLSDWAAFRLGAPGEALIHAGVVFVAIGVFGTDEGRILYPAITVSCAVAFALAHRASLGASPAPAPGPARVVPAPAARRAAFRRPRGLATGALAVAGGLVVTGALLPSLSEGRWSSWLDPATTTADAPGRVVPSPLVGIPGRLLENPELELFRVRSSERAYWRLTALGSFDGSVWSLNGSDLAAAGRLSSGATTGGPVRDVAQSYEIRALAQVWLPAAFQPRELTAEQPSFEARFEPVSSTLLVDPAHRNSDGLQYTVHSAVPQFDAAFLSSLRNDAAALDPSWVAVPDNLPTPLRQLAADVTRHAEGPYQQALALQQWFRENFVYDLSVAPGHSSGHLATFLLDTRRGYCEQFAGAFATLGRVLGLPTRVAVGFTPGIALGEIESAAGAAAGSTPGSTTPTTLYSVRGKHAHAWPEVYIDGAGWVAFEPTPGRGAPGAEAYTQVPEQQDTSPAAPDAAVAEPTAPPPGAAAPPSAATVPEALPSPDPGAAAGGGWRHTAGRVAALVGFAVAGLAGAVLAYALATVGLGNLQQRRRRRWSRGDSSRATLVAWEEVTDLLRLRRSGPRRTETPLEVAERAARDLGLEPEPLRRLAFCVSAAAFAGGQLPAAIGGEAGAAAGRVQAELRSGRSLGDRLRGILDPRPWSLLLRRERSLDAARRDNPEEPD